MIRTTSFLLISAVLALYSKVTNSEACGSDVAAEGCLSCITAGGVDCDSCKVGYYHVADTQTCNKCRYGCTSCDSREKCTSCKIRFGLIENGAEADCHVCKNLLFCDNCDGDLFVCKQCRQPGYRITAEGKCEDCSDYRCAKCDTAADKCDECEQGYGGIGVGTRCTRCKKTGCLKCPASTGVCTECDSSEADCQVSGSATEPVPIECHYGCTSCDSREKCTSCKIRFGLIKNGTKADCHVCDVPFCDNCDGNLSACKQCRQPGYRITAEGKCEGCTDYRCAKCDTSADKCDECEHGYGPRVIGTRTRCIRCFKTGCTKCPTNADVCTECDPSVAECQVSVCPYGCKSCVSADLCTSCMAGMGLKHTDTNKMECVLCEDRFCQLCSASASKCAACKAGYELGSDGKCHLKCRYGCTSCDSREKCTSCKIRFGLIENGTKADCGVCDVLFCDNCDGDLSVCKQCRQPGYRITAEGKCEGCTDYRCAKCDTSVDKCDECQQGYGPRVVGTRTRCISLQP